ncbi:MAG: FAD-dependent thymidylate synthase, partial [Magnetococcales bacterium]|nr:FAD-dependent thymidylate synthase [Magnetococcales bacterium]
MRTATDELRDEIALRCRLNPDYTAQIGSFGFLELEESWGDEATIVNTARISTTNKRVESVDAFTDRERHLLYHLLSHNHGTPFESVHFRWRVIAPIFILRQWMRHRIGTFCDWGSATLSKVTRFDMERIKAEIDWFAEKRIEFIFCCDANFGILRRDMEIIDYTV